MNKRPRLTVGALIFNDDDVLLLKIPKWEGKFVLPSGHVEFMEKIEDAVRREVKEETGLDVFDLEFIKFVEFINPKEYQKKNLHFVGMEYSCKSKNRAVVLNDESTEFLWVNPNDALKLDLEWGTRIIIEHYIKN
ncbi:MAG: NUDIX domain-containing protein [Candidatus Woesearchaeota archaeon]